MQSFSEKTDTLDYRTIAQRTHGRRHGPVTRLVSPGDLGQLIKPFVFLDMFDMDASRSNVFGFHPHSGIVTVTTMFESNVEYEDSTGKAGLLSEGAVEWMQAGSGVWHTASPVSQSQSRVRGYQLWLALPESLENAPPEIMYIDPEQVPNVGPVRVILGQYQRAISPLPMPSPITYLHVRLSDGEFWTFDPPAGHDVLWIAIDGGSINVSGETLSDELAVFDSSTASVTLQAHGAVNFMLGSAQRHPFPLVMGSYSVHTSYDALSAGEEGIRKVGAQLKANGRI